MNLSTMILTSTPDGGVIVERISPLTGKLNSMTLPVSFERVQAFASNPTPVQRQFPELNAEQREFLQTGYTPDDWKAIFK